MGRSVGIHPLYGWPARLFLVVSTLDVRIHSPDERSKFGELLRVFWVKRKRLLRLNKCTTLEPPTAKHQSTVNQWVPVENFLCQVNHYQSHANFDLLSRLTKGGWICLLPGRAMRRVKELNEVQWNKRNKVARTALFGRRCGQRPSRSPALLDVG